MYSQQFNIISRVLMMIDAAVVTAACYISYYISLAYKQDYLLVMSFYDLVGSILFLIFTNNYLMGRFGLYSEKRFSSYLLMTQSIIMVVVFEFIFFFTGIFVIGIEEISRIFIFSYFIMIFMVMTITRILFYLYMEYYSKKGAYSYKILIVGSCLRIKNAARALNRQLSWGHNIAGCLCIDETCNEKNFHLPILGKLDKFDQVLYDCQIDEVLFALPRNFSIDLEKYLNKCDIIGVAYKIVPGLFDSTRPTLGVETLNGLPILTSNQKALNVSGLLYKRILDIVVGFTGFIIFLVIYPFVAIAIRLDSPGPVIFKQKRIGMHGRYFYLYKFRSMTADAESKKTDLLVKKKTAWPELKTAKDPRITRVGKFLRKTSLDEFPQFINVVKGEMSLIGTRPPTPSEVEAYEDWHRRRISIKPGLTGLWQISGRKEITDFAQVVKLDLEYIDGWKFWKDLNILWKTAFVVLGRKGAK